MSKEILKQRIQILREPLETWLTFYGKEGKTLNEEQLISDIIIKITNYREYSYKQNREFEKLLNKKLTWKNEEHNDKKDRKSTRLNSSHVAISYAVFCLK